VVVRRKPVRRTVVKKAPSRRATPESEARTRTGRHGIVAKKASNMKMLKRLSTSKNVGNFLSIPEDDSVIVRFLEEPFEWVSFQQHYMGGYFPCVPSDCPGCEATPPNIPSTKFLANVADRNDEDKPKVLIMAKSLVDTLRRRYEKRDTITDRDYELSREGTGRDTKYDAEAQDKEHFSTRGVQLTDLYEFIDQMFDRAFGDEDDDDEEETPRRTAKKTATKVRRRPR